MGPLSRSLVPSLDWCCCCCPVVAVVERDVVPAVVVIAVLLLRSLENVKHRDYKLFYFLILRPLIKEHS